jgi:hypothetical protein
MITMPPELPVFEARLKKRGRVWRWSVCTGEGQVVVEGAESRRTSAKYKAYRALFLMLLTAPSSFIRPGDTDGRGRRPPGRSRTI